MQFEGVRRSSQVPNITPLIDIVFLLLVFFMLTSHFVREESINIELPESQSAGSSTENRLLEVVLNQHGEIIYNKKKVSVVEFQSLLHEELLKRKDKVIKIRGDRSVEFGMAVNLIDLARKAGAQGIDIVTIKNANK